MQVNPVRPTYPVEIDGQEFVLVYDFEAIVTAEDLTGRPLLLGLNRRLIDAPSVSLVRAMFFAAAHYRQPELTLEDVRKLIADRAVIKLVWPQILKVWEESFPEAKKATGPRDPQ